MTMKGKKHSEETKKKLNRIHKGKHYSPKTEFKKGRKTWCEGKSGWMTEEIVRKRTEKRRKGGWFHKPELHKKRVSKSLKKAYKEGRRNKEEAARRRRNPRLRNHRCGKRSKCRRSQESW